MEQRTEEWFNARLGKVTASRIADLMAKTKSGYSASRDSYMAQLTIERLTQKATEGYTNAAMQWGTEQEPFARAAYETKTGQLVTEVGFIVHPEIDQAGASPDGLVGDEGMVEIKCPESKTMIETLLSDRVPDKYFKQMQWQMACTGRNWCDYVVFDPRMPENLQLCVRRVERDDYIIDEIKAEINKFLAELDQQVTKLRAL
jgi:putative phage-type endonuclease